MKFSCLLLVASSLAFSFASTQTNRNPTIWSQDAIKSMKKSINVISQNNAALYSNRTIFDGAASCSVPDSSDESGSTPCSEADTFLGASNDAVIAQFQSLAQVMFPVYYGLPDNTQTPRASFSDFSHFYNQLLTGASYSFYATQWYACKANITNPSQTGLSFLSWYTNTPGLDVINAGPYTGQNGAQANNGTLTEYGTPAKPSSFLATYLSNYKKFLNGTATAWNLLGERNTTESSQLCSALLAQGLKSP